MRERDEASACVEGRGQQAGLHSPTIITATTITTATALNLMNNLALKSQQTQTNKATGTARKPKTKN